MDGDPSCDIRRIVLWFENVKPKGASQYLAVKNPGNQDMHLEIMNLQEPSISV